LVQKRLLTKTQGAEVIAKEASARARVVKASGTEKYDVSPVEIVAAFQIPFPGKPGLTIDQDVVSEAVAAAAGIGYRKIDQLRLDMALATRTVSKPYAQKHAILPIDGKPGPGTGLVVAVANPFDRMLFENLQRLTNGPIVPVLSA